MIGRVYSARCSRQFRMSVSAPCWAAEHPIIRRKAVWGRDATVQDCCILQADSECQAAPKHEYQLGQTSGKAQEGTNQYQLDLIFLETGAQQILKLFRRQ